MPIVTGSTSAGVLGTMTVGDVKSFVQIHGYGTDTTTQQTIALQFILRRLYGARRWRFLEGLSTAFSATLMNTGIVDISTLGRGIMLTSVRWAQASAPTNADDLNPGSLVDVRQKRHDDTSGVGGPPQLWAFDGENVVVYPRPDQTYTLEIDYQALDTIPSDDGDTVVWPETHIDVLTYGVIMILAWRQRDQGAYQMASIEYGNALDSLMKDEELTNRQRSREVRNWDGWAKGGTPLP